MKRFAKTASCCVILLAAGAGCFVSMTCAPRPDQSRFADLARVPEPAALVVQLRCAKILWTCAVHCWFAEFDSGTGRWHRWEVWQNAGTGPADFGHVREDLMSPTAGVGDGPSWALAEWTGPQAQSLRAALNAPQDYPYQTRYSYWPGPNSNTYVAWILKKAKVACDLPAGAIGKDFGGL
jgi:hypothetical protein